MKDPVFKEEIISGYQAKKGLFHNKFFLTIENSAKSKTQLQNPRTKGHYHN